jgi:hypothetical protein
MYTYPDSLPEGLIFVDCIGWISPYEVARYLMMGYRVWNRDGRRLHFAGTPIGYDSLKPLYRYQQKVVCTQSLDKIPELYVQIKVGNLEAKRRLLSFASY